MTRIGVYICHCGLNIAGTVDVEKVTQYASQLSEVVMAKNYTYMCSDPGKRLIQEDIKQYSLDKIVIATCSPRMHEETFRKILAEGGLNPYLLEIVNLREHVSWPHADEPEKATEKAKTLVRMGIARVKLLEPLNKKKVAVDKGVLIIGGGIAGIQASLDLADAGFKVYLIEKSPSIGGRMAQLDKTFPTLDCSACILTPKMVDVARHSNIELLCNSEVVNVKGYVGNFTIDVLKKQRYVTSDCSSCGECVKVCPITVPNEFDVNLASRHGIYIPFAQAIPSTYLIDMNSCLNKEGIEICNKCIKACERKAIKFEMKPETIQLRTGAIVVAVGSDVFDASTMAEFGYGRYPNVISNMEFERLSNASGPTNGKIVCPGNGKLPKSVVFIQCVGSRDKRFNEYCCRVGCMVSLKQAILAREKLGENADIYVCFNDMRSFGKGYEEFYRRTRDMNVDFIGGIPSEIHKTIDDRLQFDVFERGTEKLLEMHADLVVLANGIIPNSDLARINSVLHAPRSADGFMLEAHPKLRPLECSTAGIFLAGTCQGPKDIPDTVAQASGVASKIEDLLSKGEIDLEPLRAVVDDDLCSGCRVCQSLCPFTAIEINEKTEGLRAEVVEAACQGCGICNSACPAGAIKVQQYSNQQILAQVHAALVESEITVQGGDRSEHY